jgi:hypothetical protein
VADIRPARRHSRQQAQAELEDEALRPDARLVLVEAQIGIQPGHADVDARFAGNVAGVGFPEASFVQNVFRKFDDIDVIVVPQSHGCVRKSTA